MRSADPPDERRTRFEQLYAANHDPVLTYLLRRTSSRDDAADVLAETFLTAWRRLDDVPEDEQARPWLYGVARRSLANHRRGEGRRTALADRLRGELAKAGALTPDRAISSTAAEAFEELPERDRELLALVAWEGLDTAEVAVVLGCSRNAVRIRLHRARARFERLLHARTNQQQRRAEGFTPAMKEVSR
ncbi:RNA polymerase sigma factor [Kribbella deserti]|uniref:RNA polymerase sigma factor n=1 Tax=Kribbella deserti TaxID=1926257 RepID=A0ABV6QR68_9ACTN